MCIRDSSRAEKISGVLTPTEIHSTLNFFIKQTVNDFISPIKNFLLYKKFIIKYKKAAWRIRGGRGVK